MIARALRLSGDRLGGNMQVVRHVKDAGYFVAVRREKRIEHSLQDCRLIASYTDNPSAITDAASRI